MPAVAVPEEVRRKALALGPEGERWLAGLGDLIADLEAAWSVTIGDAISGGSGAFVAEAVGGSGALAVVKVAMPDGLEGNSPFAGELRLLELAGGVGYVRLLRSEPARRALLLERLGRPLQALGLPVEEQIDVLAATMQAAWRPLAPSVELRTGADQAAFLERFVQARWEELDRPCPDATVARAIACARSRGSAFDPATAVLVHGDAHTDNVLEDPSDLTGGRFKLIDPDGMRSEPAHDLAIPLRDWTDELLAGDAVSLAPAWCARLASRAGIDPGPIWEWAFVERVSTGLFLTQLGLPLGPRMLAVAERLTHVDPF